MTDQARRDGQDAQDGQRRAGERNGAAAHTGQVGGAAAAPNTISQTEAPATGSRPDTGMASGDAAADRGLPELGQRRAAARPWAWWLTPLTITVVAVAGAVWTVHSMLARHEAEARARRDHAMEQTDQGRTFADASSVPTVTADTPATVRPASAAGASTPGEARPAGRPPRVVSTRSYLDAPLLAVGGSAVNDGSTAPARGEAAWTGGETGAARGALAAASASGGPLAQALSPTSTPRVRASMLGDRNLILAQGAKIDCVGDTAFDSTQAGISTCTVTKNVYSDNGRVLLIERGSQVNTEYRANPGQGQRRVFILSARIRTPTGVTVEIDSPAADALGRMGVGGYVDNHWGERIGAALLLGLVQDSIGYLATRGGNDNGSIEFENTQQSGNDMATRVLDSTISIPPTLTQNQAAEFTIVIARDLDFSSVYALQPARMEDDHHVSP